MPEFLLGLALGAISASACWWLYNRSLSGVTSDLKDVVTDVKKVAGK